MLPFLLQVHAQSPRCLIIEEAANGWKSLTSPDYPKKFSPHTQCIYRYVKKLEREKILNFMQLFCWQKKQSGKHILEVFNRIEYGLTAIQQYIQQLFSTFLFWSGPPVSWNWYRNWGQITLSFHIFLCQLENV